MNPYDALTDAEVAWLFSHHANNISSWDEMNEEKSIARFRRFRALVDEVETRASKRAAEFAAKGGLS